MTTFEQYAQQCRDENPPPVEQVINGEPVTLSADEYETMVNEWATMRVEQDAKMAADEAAVAATVAAIAHAKSLGFTDEMIAVMYPNLQAP